MLNATTSPGQTERQVDANLTFKLPFDLHFVWPPMKLACQNLSSLKVDAVQNLHPGTYTDLLQLASALSKGLQPYLKTSTFKYDKVVT